MQRYIKVVLSLMLTTLFVHFGVSQVVIVDNYKDLNDIYLNVDDDTTRVVNFWATWCKPCVKELPYFEALNKEIESQKIIVYLVSLDFKSQLEKRLIPFVEENKLTSSVVAFIDPNVNDWIPQINEKWSGAIPATYISKGKSSWFREGDFESKKDILTQIKNLN